MKDDKMNMDETEWKKKLNPSQYDVLRGHGTEAAFSGEYWNNHEDGMYHCAGCGSPLFSSRAKFDSGTGWPSFTRAADNSAITEHEDNAYGMKRIEVRCSTCGGHLGHIFPDGPQEGEHAEGTGARLCINSCALEFTEEKKDRKS